MTVRVVEVVLPNKTVALVRATDLDGAGQVAEKVGAKDVFDLAGMSGTRLQAMIADPALPMGTRLALARLHSGQADDDPDAHFQLATLTLLAILDQAAPLAREAAAALADCTANAAPFEQRDFTRCLTQIGAEHPRLAPFTAEFQHILTSTTDPAPEH